MHDVLDYCCIFLVKSIINLYNLNKLIDTLLYIIQFILHNISIICYANSQN